MCGCCRVSTSVPIMGHGRGHILLEQRATVSLDSGATDEVRTRRHTARRSTYTSDISITRSGHLSTTTTTVHRPTDVGNLLGAGDLMNDPGTLAYVLG